MATFDESARQTCKIDGHGLMAWLDRLADESMEADFANWDDTRRTSWPGGPERTDDVVCVLRRRADGSTADGRWPLAFTCVSRGLRRVQTRPACCAEPLRLAPRTRRTASGP